MPTTSLAPADPLPLDAALREQLASAADCAAVLEEHGAHIAFATTADGVEIAVRGAGGVTLRRLRPSELLTLIDLPPAALSAWAARPELPIPGRGEPAPAR